MEAALEANEVDEDQLIEERRRRRQEILAKHGQTQGQAQPGMRLSGVLWQQISWDCLRVGSVPLATIFSASQLFCGFMPPWLGTWSIPNGTSS